MVNVLEVIIYIKDFEDYYAIMFAHTRCSLKLGSAKTEKQD